MQVLGRSLAQMQAARNAAAQAGQPAPAATANDGIGAAVQAALASGGSKMVGTPAGQAAPFVPTLPTAPYTPPASARPIGVSPARPGAKPRVVAPPGGPAAPVIPQRPGIGSNVPLAPTPGAAAAR